MVGHRASGARSCRTRPRPHACVRLVHARWIVGDRVWRIGRRRPDAHV
jgi:hypothetical protein